jgi:hypothetical protein
MSQPSPATSSAAPAPQAAVTAAQFQQMQSAVQHLLTQQQQQAAAAAAAPVRTKLPKLPPPSKFRGESGFRVDAWIRELQRQFEYYDPDFASDDLRIRFAVAFMEDLAAQWWLDAAPTLRQEQHGAAITWNVFVQALHTRFRPLESALVARQQLEQLQQGSQSVDQYAHRFQAVLTAIKDMSEADKVYRFVVNLRNAVKQKVLQEGHKTLREAIQSAASHEAAYKFSRPHPAQSYPRFAPYTRSDASGSVPMDINNVESEYQEEDDESFGGAVGSTVSAFPESAFNALAAKLTAHMDQRINAVVQQRRGAFPPRRSNDRVPGLTPEELERCMRNGLCLLCKKHGHMKRECPEHIKPHASRLGK